MGQGQGGLKAARPLRASATLLVPPGLPMAGMDGCGFVPVTRLVDKMEQETSPEEVLEAVRQDEKVGPRHLASPSSLSLLSPCL